MEMVHTKFRVMPPFLMGVGMMADSDMKGLAIVGPSKFPGW